MNRLFEPETPSAWLGVVSRSHVQRGVAGGFIQLCHGKAAPLRRMAEGDRMVYYSPRTEMGGGEPLQAFTAYGIIGPPDTRQVEMAPDFHPFRRSVRFLEAREAPIRPLLPHISFTREGQNWGLLLRRGHLPLTAEDLALIAEAMGVRDLGSPQESGRRGWGGGLGWSIEVPMSFRVLPLPTSLADEARRTGRAPGYGHRVQASKAPAGGYGPCRHCLGRTLEGEGRLLLNYNPYPEAGEVPVVGPVFIHEAACPAFDGAGFPEGLRGLPLVFQGHLAGGAGLVNRRGEGAREEAVIEALFEDPRIAFITLRNAEAGCFIARVARA